MTSNKAHTINETAWQEWATFRKREKRKPIGPMAQKRQQALLSQYDHETQRAMIERSILCSWQGLFPLPDPPQTLRRRTLVEDLTDTSWAR